MRKIFTPGPRLRELGRWLGAGAAAWCLAAASVGNRPMPVALGLVCAAPPGLRLAAAIGGSIGYGLFWGQAQPLLWMGTGLVLTALMKKAPAHFGLMPALAAVIVAGTGLGLLLAGREDGPTAVFLMRVTLAAGSAAVFSRWRRSPSGPAGWLTAGLGTLALAQIAPSPWFSLGYLAAGFITGRYALPAAAMAGLGLDLAQVTRLPMTGILCLGFCLRLLPRSRRWAPALGAAVCCLLLSAATGRWDLRPVPGLLIGGVVSQLLPPPLPGPVLRRQGRTGLAQLRLERCADGLDILRQELGVDLSPEPDPEPILRRAADSACDACPERRGCRVRKTVPELTGILGTAGLRPSDLPPGCKKPGRLLNELRRGQEQLRFLRGQRNQRRSCRTAVAEQYEFLSDRLRQLSEELIAADPLRPSRFRGDIGICSHGREAVSGDRCEYFEGPGGLYVLLCDGMGTGDGAAAAARQACCLIRRLLEAGFSAAQALKSYNSQCILRCEGGWATVDLLEVDLHTGRGQLHKWGAGPSYLLRQGQLRPIGTAGPPPGLSQQARHWVGRLSLGEGDTLIMLSDGAQFGPLPQVPELPPEALARWLAGQCKPTRDDATVAAVRLDPCPYITTLRQNNLSKHNI